jgi:hypothetical protein
MILTPRRNRKYLDLVAEEKSATWLFKKHWVVARFFRGQLVGPASIYNTPMKCRWTHERPTADEAASLEKWERSFSPKLED